MRQLILSCPHCAKDIRIQMGVVTEPQRNFRERPILMPAKERLIEIVRDNPGLDGRGIFAIHEESNRRRVTFWLSDLRRQGYLENRGGRGPSSRWYVKEN